MALVLRADETLEKTVEIKSIYGKAMMYVTNKSIIIQTEKQGMVFERLHTQIASIEAISKNKIKITWPEDRTLHPFEFKTNDAVSHVNDILSTHNYDDNFPDIMGANTVLLTENDKKNIIEKRLTSAKKSIIFYKEQLDEENQKLNSIASDDPDKTNKILETAELTKVLHDIVEMYEKYLKAIPNIMFNRSKKIPKDVPNHLCWNDCWVDVESDCFVTLNNLWNQDFYKENDNAKKFYETNKIPNAYAIPANTFIKFIDGYPTFPIRYGENDTRYVLIPTMTDEMLTDNMISKKFGLDIDTVGDGIPQETSRTMNYKISEGSKLILKNSEKYKKTRKETVFFLNRKMIPKDDLELLP